MFVLRQYFFGVMRNKLHWTTASETSNTKYLELIKRRSKVQEKNMSCECGLNFDQWKTFSENSKPMRVYGLFTNLPRIIVACDFSQSSFKLRRGILPLLTNTYPNLKTTCRIKLKFSCEVRTYSLQNISYLSLRF